MTGTTTNLETRRFDAFVTILRTALGTTLAGAAPAPAAGLAKSLGISLADAWMCYDIYRIYFGRELSEEEFLEMLGVAGVIVVIGGVASYGTLKVAQSLFCELLGYLPLVGWLAAGLLTGSTSTMLGLAWLTFIEDLYVTGEMGAGEAQISPM